MEEEYEENDEKEEDGEEEEDGEDKENEEEGRQLSIAARSSNVTLFCSDCLAAMAAVSARLMLNACDNLFGRIMFKDNVKCKAIVRVYFGMTGPAYCDIELSGASWNPRLKMGDIYPLGALLVLR